jgi:hypothetical protein
VEGQVISITLDGQRSPSTKRTGILRPDADPAIAETLTAAP